MAAFYTEKKMSISDFVNSDLCCIAKASLRAVFFGVFSYSVPKEIGLDSYSLINKTMMLTTDKDTLICLECHSMNCVTHFWDDEVHGSDYYGECLECGSADVAYEGSSVWENLVESGVLA